jgi:mannose-6-phosphate isomerase-like protein (cupin superfamily)
MTETITEKIHDPIHRSAYAFRRQGEDLWVDTWLEDGGHLPEHFHPSLEEHWEALEGTVRVKLAGTWRDLVPEDGPVLVARNVRHELKNTSGQRIHARAHVIPAGRLEDFLTETARAAQEGLYNSRNLPTSWRGAVWAADLAQRFRDETVVCSPPPAVQRILTPLVARFAR